MREQWDELRRSVGITARGWIALFAIALLWGVVLAPAAVIGWQVLYWLRHGQWAQLSLWDGLAYLGIEPPFPPVGEWEGVEQMLLFILKTPLSLSLFIGFVLALMIFGSIYSAWLERKKP